jgi:hypothetical protein
MFDVTSVTSLPQIIYKVDDGPWTQATVAATVSLTIPADNNWASHLVQFQIKSIDFTSNRWPSRQAPRRFL